MPSARFAILAQKLSALLHGSAWRRILLALLLPFFGIMAAFGIAPDTITDTVERSNVVEQIALPALPASGDLNESFWREARIERGDTSATVLQRLQIDDSSAAQVMQRTTEARALYRLIPGRTIRAHTTAAGQLLALRYLNGTQLLKIDREGDALVIAEGAADVETRLHMRSGEIKTSLFAATDAVGLPDHVAMQIAEIFSGDIDFHRDLRKGDRFSVVFEQFHQAGRFVRTGRVLAVEFINGKRSLQAVWFEGADNNKGYFSPDGKNLRKAFLEFLHHLPFYGAAVLCLDDPHVDAGIVAIEWPDRLVHQIPGARSVTIEIVNETRRRISVDERP